jgi:hypothetical protein
MGKDRHTIILVQYTSSYGSRSFMDFPTIGQALDAVVKMYEAKLKELNPGQNSIEYDISHLYQYLDSLQDICALVLDNASAKYEPHDKEWVKQNIFQQLKKAASGK